MAHQRFSSSDAPVVLLEYVVARRQGLPAEFLPTSVQVDMSPEGQCQEVLNTLVLTKAKPQKNFVHICKKQ